jgi:putative intracellular protease/amidase
MPPIDPKSEDDSNTNNKLFTSNSAAMNALKNTKKLNDIKDDSGFDAVFVPGGHGPLWDLANDSKVADLLEKFSNARKPIAAGMFSLILCEKSSFNIK